MMGTTLVGIVLCAGAAFAAPPAPDWVKSQGKAAAYPEARFFTGFGEASVGGGKDQAQCQEMARDYAKRNLIQSIQVNVKTVGRSKAEEKNGDYSEYASAVTESVSNLDVPGLKTELFPAKGLCYAFAATAKSDVVRHYSARAKDLESRIKGLMETASAAEAKGDRNQALDDYIEAQKALKDYQDAKAVADLASGGAAEALEEAKADAEAAFEELEAELSGKPRPRPQGGRRKADLPSAAELRKAITRVVEKPVKSLSDAAWLLAFCLRSQGEASSMVRVEPFTFKDTRMASPFARYFKELVGARLRDTAKWVVADGAKASHVLAGTYWPQADGLKLVARMRRIEDGGTSASTDLTVPAAVVAAANLQTEPQNYKDALADQKVFEKGELKGGGLRLEAWTNKGSDNLVFVRGERMKVFVRANLPSYVRLIYHLADRRRTLLLDNYLIDSSKVNAPYELPQEFEADEPFGAETLQAFASTERFDPLATRRADGYDILAEDLGVAIARTRGMKKVAPGAQKAETRLVVTTMEK